MKYFLNAFAFISSFFGKKGGVLCFFGLVLGVFFPDFVFAQASSDLLSGFAQILSLFVNLFTFLALQLIELSGRLMGTEWITGVEAMKGIRPMWILVRNLVNISFVAVLVGLSFTNLFGGLVGNDEWSIKNKLPKVILALIAVNFSLLAMRVAVDLVHVGSISILSIADTSLETHGGANVNELLRYRSDKDGNRCFDANDSCKSFAEHLNGIFCDEAATTCWVRVEEDAAIATSSSTAQNLFLAFGVHFQHLQRLPQLSAELGEWTEVAQDALFSVMMAIVYVIALGAIFLALLARVVMLWIGMVASPVFVAGSIIGISGLDDLRGKVVGYLIMPLKISLALAVSFVMMAGMSDGVVLSEANTFIRPGTSVFSLGTMGFVWQILTVVVFWFAAQWSLKDAAYVDKFIDGIFNQAQDLGEIIGRWGLIDRPLFPTHISGPSGKKVNLSLGSLYQLPTQSISEMQYEQNRRRRQQVDDFQDLIAPGGMTDREDNGKLIERFHQRKNKGYDTIDEAESEVGKTLLEMGTDRANKQEWKNRIAEMAKQVRKRNIPMADAMEALIVNNPGTVSTADFVKIMEKSQKEVGRDYITAKFTSEGSKVEVSQSTTVSNTIENIQMDSTDDTDFGLTWNLAGNEHKWEKEADWTVDNLNGLITKVNAIVDADQKTTAQDKLRANYGKIKRKIELNTVTDTAGLKVNGLQGGKAIPVDLDVDNGEIKPVVAS